MKNLNTLITNDDGPDSPLIQALAQAVNSRFKTTTLAVPRVEQSWIADAITKFRPLQVTRQALASLPASLIDGTPADCVQIGCFKIAEQVPDLVISGINFGSNASMPLFMSSGTVGAASAGAVAGIRSVAFSAKLPQELFDAWEHRDFARLNQEQEMWDRLANVSLAILEDLLQVNAWQYANFISVNMRWDATIETTRRITSLEPGRFGAIFRNLEADVYKHHFQRVERDEVKPADSDVVCLEQGDISITPISLAFRPAIDAVESLSASLNSLR